MGRREELLAGVHRHNKEEISDATKASEEAAANVGVSVEGGPDQRKSGAAGVTGGSVQANKSNIPAHEISLEEILQSQVDGLSEAILTAELEIADCKSELKRLRRSLGDMMIKRGRVIQALEVVSGNDSGSTNAKDPVPTKGPGLKNETMEDSK